ncbi:MAG: multidrug effflux MFS transporter [Paracoccaceae bacterium]
MIRTAIILGCLSMVGPFAIDMFLPAMPDIAQSLSASPAETQITVTAYFAAFGIAQMIYGPLADQTGRKLPILLGLSIFLIGSLGSAMADTITGLGAWRFVQGLGGAAVMVVPRAIIRDMFTGVEAMRLMAMLMLVISVSPMLAPLVGSGVVALGGWRWVFGAMAIAAGASLLLTLFFQPETLPKEARVPINLRSLAAGCRQLFRDADFMGLTFVGAFGFASFFVFIATAPFVYTGSFGLSPTGFSLAFAVNAIGFFAASQASGPIGARIGLRRLLRLGIFGFAGATALLFVLVLAGVGSLWLVIGGLFVANAFLGLVIPAVMVMALDHHGDIAGLASSLGGTLQMLTGGLVVVLAGPFLDGGVTAMVAVIALTGLVTLILFFMTPARAEPPAQAEAD